MIYLLILALAAAVTIGLALVTTMLRSIHNLDVDLFEKKQICGGNR